MDSNYFETEIDSIYNDLSDMNEKINFIKSSYSSYFKNFLELCDQKDEFFSQFLEYYLTFIMDDKQALKSNKKHKSKKINNDKSSQRVKTRSYVYSVPIENRFSILSI